MNVELDNITMKFDQTMVLNNISTTIEEGELVSLLGPSGCGKSTLLMILSGLLSPYKGQVLFNNEDVTKRSSEKRGIGMVFQNYALYPHMTVLKNIMFPLLMQKVNKRQAKEEAMKYAKLVQIDHLASRKPSQLSGGQQQRVAIARALVKNPQLLLLDEPLSNLDSNLRVEMREEIRDLQKRVGITTVFVTHDQEEAFSISDRVILMNQGKIQQAAKPLDMYYKPNNLFVSRFLGNPQINLIDRNEMKNQERLQHDTNVDPDRAVIYGIRPEHLFLTDEDSASFSGIVKRIEVLGKELLLHVDCEGITLRALISSEMGASEGDTCHLGFKDSHLLVFDTKTEQRILAKGDYEIESSTIMA